MLLGQAPEQFADFDLGLRPIFLQFDEALRRVDTALEMAGPTRGKSSFAACCPTAMSCCAPRGPLVSPEDQLPGRDLDVTAEHSATPA